MATADTYLAPACRAAGADHAEVAHSALLLHSVGRACDCPCHLGQAELDLGWGEEDRPVMQAITAPHLVTGSSRTEQAHHHHRMARRHHRATR